LSASAVDEGDCILKLFRTAPLETVSEEIAERPDVDGSGHHRLAPGRTAFRDDPEHHRRVATLASRLRWKVFGFVK
jgi:hypothetical protein